MTTFTRVSRTNEFLLRSASDPSRTHPREHVLRGVVVLRPFERVAVLDDDQAFDEELASAGLQRPDLFGGDRLALDVLRGFGDEPVAVPIAAERRYALG